MRLQSNVRIEQIIGIKELIMKTNASLVINWPSYYLATSNAFSSQTLEWEGCHCMMFFSSQLSVF